MSQLIYVDNNLFLGRVREQNEFRATLRDLLDVQIQNEKPYIALIYGDGGMGKTTLSKRFRDIALWEQPFEQNFESLWVDWEIERTRNVSLQGGRENVRPETVFDQIHSNAIRQGWGRHFNAYQKIKKQHNETEHAAVAVLSRELPERLAPLRGFSADAIAKLVRTSFPMIGNIGEAWTQEAADVGLEIAIEQGLELHNLAKSYLQGHLKPELFQKFMAPQEEIALAIEVIFQIASMSKLHKADCYSAFIG